MLHIEEVQLIWNIKQYVVLDVELCLVHDKSQYSLQYSIFIICGKMWSHTYWVELNCQWLFCVITENMNIVKIACIDSEALQFLCLNHNWHILAHSIMHESQAVTFRIIATILIRSSRLKVRNESILYRILSFAMHQTQFHIKHYILFNIMYQLHFLNMQHMHLFIIHPMLLHIVLQTMFLYYPPDIAHNYIANAVPCYASLALHH